MMSPFKKPDVEEVHAFLREHNALIVHFSGTPPSGCGKHHFPADLRNVLDLGAMTGLSCSLVVPGDNFDDGKGPRNAYGSVGVILDLTDKDSLATATAGDGGALIVNCAREFDERDLDIQKVKDSLLKRDGANEWGIRNYTTIGIFIADPIQVNTPGLLSPNVDEPFIRAAFPDQRIFSFSGSEIVEILPDARRVIVNHTELYPEDRLA
jgi:hypothetical protein